MHASQTLPAKLLAPAPVTALELAAIKHDRTVLERLRQHAAQLERVVADREASVIARIEAGAAVDGDAVVVSRRRQNISWFTVCRRELGDEFVDAERQSWPVTHYKDLQIP